MRSFTVSITDGHVLLDKYTIKVYTDLSEIDESDMTDADFTYTENYVIQKAQKDGSLGGSIFREIAIAMGIL